MPISVITTVSRCERAAELRFGDGEVRVAVVSLDADAPTVAALAAWLSPEELERASRCHFERDRSRFIVARARLRELLAERLGTAPDALAFTVGEHGKPALAARHAGWQFNLSHSGDIAVVALSAGRRVGIDVEVVRDVRGAEEIAEHCFSRSERSAYRALEPRDRMLGFLNCWTRKEAFVKAVGAGMSWSYDRFDVSLAPDAPARLLRVDDLPGERCGWRLDAFEPAPGFVAALVSEHRETTGH